MHHTLFAIHRCLIKQGMSGCATWPSDRWDFLGDLRQGTSDPHDLLLDKLPPVGPPFFGCNCLLLSHSICWGHYQLNLMMGCRYFFCHHHLRVKQQRIGRVLTLDHHLLTCLLVMLASTTNSVSQPGAHMPECHASLTDGHLLHQLTLVKKDQPGD